MTALRQGSRVGASIVRFSFDGREYVGQAGDTAASALLANGVRLFGRSIKYRRLRGVFAAGPEEPNALLTVGADPVNVPNMSAPELLLHDGMVLRSQNRWPTLRCDVATLLRVGAAFFGAGFYYKTFMWPSWKFYEPLIRALAGLGRPPGTCSLPSSGVEYLSCDVAVVGAGAAGLSAALAASRAGAHVVLCEREPMCGGELDFEHAVIDGHAAADWIARTLEELAARRARVLTGAALVGCVGGTLTVQAATGGIDCLHHIRARHIVAAMGAVERPIAFNDNDFPGVMLLGAAERYAARYGVKVGRQAVLFANHDRVYAAASRLLAAGVGIRAIVDTRAAPMAGSQSASGTERTALSQLRETLSRAGVECLSGHAVVAARGARGVTSAEVAPLSDPLQMRRIACDSIFVSGGWSPVPHTELPGGSVAGAAADTLDIDAVLAEGHAAGLRAARLAGAEGDAGTAPRGSGDAPPGVVGFHRSPARPADEKRQFVDLQNDVTVADLRLALAEGFSDIEHVKRYTTLGIGTEQGRTAGALGAALLAELKGVRQAPVRVSRARAPYQPVALQSLVGFKHGDALHVTRRTPLHEWHAAHGAVLEPMGSWMRPRYYRQHGVDAFSAGVAEARRVRSHGGLMDASTLGKIEVAGPGAAAFLDRLHLGKASTVRVGRARYMVSLREDGMVLDDGIVLRLGPERFLATVSSGHALDLLSHFEHYQAMQRGQGLTITDVTDAWAVIVAAGPASLRTVAETLGTAWRESLDRLGHMDGVEGRYEGEVLRVVRASFSGERAYELHCRPLQATWLWQRLVDAGLAPYGLEALDILRVEKGYLTAAEINGQTTPYDLGMEALVALGNPCLGRALLDRPAFHEAERPRLVGLRAAEAAGKFLAGSQLTTSVASTRALGHVTSSVFSAELDCWVGLALVARTHAGLDTVLMARDPLRSGDATVRVVPAAHVDPEGLRMKA